MNPNTVKAGAALGSAHAAARAASGSQVYSAARSLRRRRARPVAVRSNVYKARRNVPRSGPRPRALLRSRRYVSCVLLILCNYYNQLLTNSLRFDALSTEVHQVRASLKQGGRGVRPLILRVARNPQGQPAPYRFAVSKV